VNAEAVPTSDAIAARAYVAMRRPPRAREHFDALLATEQNARAALWQTLSRDERDAAAAYASRRLELREIYGDAAPTMQAREDCLAWLRRPDAATVADKIAWVKRYYARDADTLADFINDWGYTIDPRLISEGRNPVVAFALFPRQREMIRWMIGCWIDSTPGVVVKSRDVGASWVAMALLATLCIFRNGFAAGVGSAVEIKIDRSGDPDSLFYKLRSFLEHLPIEFNAGFDVAHCSADKRVTFPLTGSSITGEAGDQAGRGGRKAIFIVDESAHFEHPNIIDKNLSANTRCRIDMSSVNGSANSFFRRAHKQPAIRRFDYTWRDDPRRDDAWAAKTQEELDEVTWKQEYMCDFKATLEGAVIPREWADATVDIDKFLGIEMTGGLRAALDIADRGLDLNAFAVLKGRRVIHASQWSGKGSDTGYSVQRAMKLAEEHGLTAFDYDADGMGGAAVHSDARLINEARTEAQAKLVKPTPAEYFTHGTIGTHPYRGSEAVVRPEQIVPGTKRKAVDLFANRKAQSWYEARLACYNAWQARRGKPYVLERILCIPSDLPLRELLLEQLSQATIKETMTGKIQIDKNPDEEASPDMADAVVMALAPRKSSLNNMGALLTAVSAASNVRR
jgi:phage terminase large subunit